MKIEFTANYTQTATQYFHRFILTPEGKNTTEDIIALINKFKVMDTSITCTDVFAKWGQFMEYHGINSVVYEIPAEYADAFNLYVKTINMVLHG